MIFSSGLLPPIHPGEILKHDVLEPLDMSVSQLAKALAVDAARLNEIVRGRRGITADTALSLARYLGTSAEFWLNLQADFELRETRDPAIGVEVDYPSRRANMLSRICPHGIGILYRFRCTVSRIKA